eukprot:356655-Chlamydomonas_euryale.AAC.4
MLECGEGGRGVAGRSSAVPGATLRTGLATAGAGGRVPGRSRPDEQGTMVVGGLGRAETDPTLIGSCVWFRLSHFQHQPAVHPTESSNKEAEQTLAYEQHETALLATHVTIWTPWQQWHRGIHKRR